MASANVANTLVVPVESKVAPFYDDFDESKNFQRILFRPGYAVQARELTQIQTIMQNQIERFGRHIFVNGSSVIGGKIDLTDMVTLNLAVQYANSDIVIENFKNQTITYSSGNNAVIAKVIQVSAGNEAEPPALHVKYISGEEFGPGSTIKTTTGTNFASLVPTANASVPGLASFIYDSIYFFDGYFIKVPTQAVVAGKYNRIPTIRLGLELQDDIVTESSDTSLLDPALEASNYQAPGAARYKTELVYSTRTLDSVDDEKYIQIAKLTNGVITEQVKTPIYSEIEDVLARRTYDESGNYVVKPFILTVEDSSTDPANNFVLSISSGKAYIYGYEAERQGETKIEMPRARDKVAKTNYPINLNYGNYVIVEDLTGIFNTAGVGTVDMHCVAQSAINFANTTTYNSTKTGTVRVRDLEFYSGEELVSNRKFEYYFFDARFQTLSGKTASLGASNTEIILQADNTSNVDDAYAGAYIKITSGANFGEAREIATYNSSTKLATVYSPFSSIVAPDMDYTILYDITDTDSFCQSIDYTTGATINATATISAISKDNGSLSGNTVVSEPNREIGFFRYPETFIASGITEESYVYRRVYNSVQFINGESSVITASTDEDFVGATGTATSTTVLDNFLVIVRDNQGGSRQDGEQIAVSAIVTGTTPEQAVLTTDSADDTFIATVYSKMSAYDTAAQPRVKSLVKANTKNFTSDTAANTFVGPTGSTAIVYPNAGQVVILNPSKESFQIESLYLSDVIKISKIYAYGGNSAPTANADISGYTDVTARYETDSGQRITHYDHAAIRLKPGYSAPTGNLIICCRAFKTTNDVGYFSIDSYPNLNTVVTEEGENIGTGYTLVPSLGSTRLTDVIDFRPVRPNATNTENFSFNTNRIPVPMTDFRSDYSYYLPRRDIVSLNLNREIELIKGKSQANPVFPTEPTRNLTLHKLSLNPYTLSVKDVIVEHLDHRRYTMKDIAAIDRRLKNVEYSVSLSALETRASDILIEDVDGLDRTKYGILAESFNSHLLGDTQSSDYACAIDTTGKYSGTDGMLMPKLKSHYTKLKANTKTAIGVSLHDDKVMLGYTTSAAISQTVATKTTPVADYLFASFRGDIITIPEADIWKDTTVLSDVVVTFPDIIVRPVDDPDVVDNLGPGSGNPDDPTDPPNKEDPPFEKGTDEGRPVTPVRRPYYHIKTDSSTVDEGNTFIITLKTKNLPVGTVVPYTITGVTSADINGANLKGSFVTSSNTQNGRPDLAKITFTTSQDTLIENFETFRITLDEPLASRLGPSLTTTTVVIRDLNLTPVFSLSSDKSSVNEGNTVTLTLTTTNVNDGTLVPYTITGVSSADISAASLTGSFNVSSGSSNVTFTIASDVTTEGLETLTMTLNSYPRIYQSVDIGDTSTSPSYALFADKSTVQEGNTLTITVSTTNVANGTSLPYTITGVTSADISGASLTGSFTVNSGADSKSFNIAADASTEGTEVLLLTLDTITPSVNVKANISDTSVTPSAPVYVLSSDKSSVNEGNTVTVTLTTTNLEDGNYVPYTITGVSSADISGANLTGVFVVTSGKANAVFNIAADVLTEGSETLLLTLDSISPTVSKSIVINDTSISPSYRLSSNKSSIFEGNTVTITLSTTNVTDGTSVPYTITGVSSADISNTSLTGSFTVDKGKASRTFTVVDDAVTEDVETMTLTLNEIKPTVSKDVVIYDAVPLPIYDLAANNTVINEGQSVTITLYTTNVANNTNVPYTVTGVTANIISGANLTGNFVTSSGTSSVNFVVPANILSDGNQSLVLSLNSITPTVSETVTIVDVNVKPDDERPLVYEMLMVLMDSPLYGGLGSLQYNKTTGTYSNEGVSVVLSGGVGQTVGMTYGQVANYVEHVMFTITGTKINITEADVSFIDKCYRDIINRPPEGAGLTYWAQLFAAGNYTEQEKYQAIVDGSVASREVTSFADDIVYSLTPSFIFPRDQFTYSVVAAATTENFEGLKAANYTDILADDNMTRRNTTVEYFTDLYQSYLGREPDDGGLEYWVNQANDLGIKAAIGNFRDAADINLAAGVEPGGTPGFNVFTGR